MHDQGSRHAPEPMRSNAARIQGQTDLPPKGTKPEVTLPEHVRSVDVMQRDNQPRLTMIHERGKSTQVAPISTPHLLVVLKMHDLRFGKHGRRTAKFAQWHG
jgi:hypothetical protein